MKRTALLLILLAACSSGTDTKACSDGCEKAHKTAKDACGPYPEGGSAADQAANRACGKAALEASYACTAACNKK